jgi:hypothetical protein
MHKGKEEKYEGERREEEIEKGGEQQIFSFYASHVALRQRQGSYFSRCSSQVERLVYGDKTTRATTLSEKLPHQNGELIENIIFLLPTLLSSFIASDISIRPAITSNYL